MQRRIGMNWFYILRRPKAIRQLEYSKCSLKPGWNVKYKKSGKALCALYPMEDYFIDAGEIGKNYGAMKSRLL